jgi:cysteine desulfurase
MGQATRKENKNNPLSHVSCSPARALASAGHMSLYLDYAAATPTNPQVIQAMLPYFHGKYGNPSSLYSSGRRAAQIIAKTKEEVAKALGARPEEIIFTGSGTESDNLAIMGAARANRTRGNHIIISAIEHKATLEAAHQLEKEGFEISILPVDHDGFVDLTTLKKLLRDETILVSVMYVNNEIGTIQPVAEIVQCLRDFRETSDRRQATRKENKNNPLSHITCHMSHIPLLHTDASQATGFLELNVDKLGVDLMTLNSSKIYGPKGVGMLYKRTGVEVSPVIIGGGQENGLRAGTESVPLIVGFGAALLSAEKMRASESKRLIILRNYLITKLQARIPSMVLNGHPIHRSPNNVNISIPYIEGESMLLMLDELGIEASTGSACSARDLKPSHVLLAIGQPDELAHGSIRFSLGRGTTKKQLDYLLKVFPPIVKRLTAISALTRKIK